MDFEEQIHFADMMNIIDGFDEEGNPLVFSIKVCKYNEKQQTGGDFMTIEKACKVVAIKKSGNGTKKVIYPSSMSNKEKQNVNPNHWKNSTRNIMPLTSKVVRKIHIRLIDEFNGKKIIW